MKTSWDVEKDGTPYEIQVDADEVSFSSGRGPAAGGTAVKHKAFLGGRFQDHVLEHFGDWTLLEVIAAVRSFQEGGTPASAEKPRLKGRVALLALDLAIREGDVKAVRALIEDGVDVNHRAQGGYSTLMKACLATTPHRVEVVKALLEGGAAPNASSGGRDNVLLALLMNLFPGSEADLAPIASLLLDHGLHLETRDEIGRTALIAACAAGDPALVAVLLERGADLNASTEGRFGETALTAAGTARRGQPARVLEVLLEHGADPEKRSPHGASFLQRAAEMGDVPLVQKLLARGADVNRSLSGLELTELMSAAREGHEDVLEKLLEAGADIGARDYAGRQALAHAAGKGKLGAVSLLLDRGADVQASDRDGNAALSHALTSEYAKAAEIVGIVERLLDRGADANSRNRHGATALMLACEGPRAGADAVRLLLARGAVVYATDGEGHTALDRLVRGLFLGTYGKRGVSEKEMETIAALLAAGADPNRRDECGCTPVANAAILGHADLVRLLAEHGADVNAADGLGVTPLMQAALYGHADVARVLKGAGAKKGPKTTPAPGKLCAPEECPICRPIPAEAYADFNHGESLPGTYLRLHHVPPPSGRVEHLRCPYCGNDYDLEESSDNSEFYPVYSLRRTKPKGS
jgi:ankyrin repeat protein